MISLQLYPKYKPSSVDWLGDLSSRWSADKIVRPAAAAEVERRHWSISIKRSLGYLAHASQWYGTDRTHCKHEIDLIQEYRTRLISDVVTAKLEVRAKERMVNEEI